MVQKEPQGAFVFDLDSTLICVHQRSEAILRHIAQSPDFQENHFQEAEVLSRIQVHPQDFSLKEILRRAGLKNLSFSLYKKIFMEWTRFFFSNDFLKYDQLYKGVHSYLSALNAAGAKILYLTGRSRSLMGPGTLLQLKKWRIPLQNENCLIMKNNTFTEDAFFKKNCLKDLLKIYKKIWFFENEPVIINFVQNFLPEIQIIFVQTAHSRRQTVKKEVPRIFADYS